MPRVLGVDIGGTSSRARLAVDGTLIAEARAESANASAVGVGEASLALEALLGRLPLERYVPLDAACAGAAGAVGATVVQLFSQRLGPLTSGGKVSVVGDVHLVLPAAGLEQGVALICGTGSAALGSDGARTVTAGGWGYLLGDEASGYWVTRQAFRSLLESDDRGKKLGTLGAQLLEATHSASLDELRAGFYADPRPGKWAGLAPLVLASDDPVTTAILEEAARYLDKQVETVLGRLEPTAALPIVLAGGLSSITRFSETVTAHLRSSRPGSKISVLREPPVAGAVRLAERAAATTRR